MRAQEPQTSPREPQKPPLPSLPAQIDIDGQLHDIAPETRQERLFEPAPRQLRGQTWLPIAAVVLAFFAVSAQRASAETLTRAMRGACAALTSSGESESGEVVPPGFARCIAHRRRHVGPGRWRIVFGLTPLSPVIGGEHPHATEATLLGGGLQAYCRRGRIALGVLFVRHRYGWEARSILTNGQADR